MRVRYSFSSRRTGRISPTNKHHKPIPTLVKEIIRISDIVLEIIDTRFIEETRNKELEKLILDSGKKIIFVLNKSDLIDVAKLKRDIDLGGLKPYVLISCKTRKGIKELRTKIKIEAKRMRQKRNTHVGIIGYPNTGKSSIINVVAGGGRAKTAAESGFTKGIQKVKLAKGILLLDSPGVIPEREAPAHRTAHAKKLSIIGVKTFDRAKNPDFIVFELMRKYPGTLEEFYKIDAKGDSEKLIEELGRKNKFLKKGGSVDIDRTARFILKDWQLGKIKV